MPTRIPEAHPLDHYGVLSLQPPSTQQQIRTAYHRALLLHHPDKSAAKTAPGSKDQHHSIDALTHAYRILSNPTTKTVYDRELLLTSTDSSKPATSLESFAQSHTGIETVDLSDMRYDPTKTEFYRSCRCGRERGYVVTEAQLEEHAEDEEIVVGCVGCSLWARVTFAVAEGDAEPAQGGA